MKITKDYELWEGELETVSGVGRGIYMFYS
jgi:hypothetical protein